MTDLTSVEYDFTPRDTGAEAHAKLVALRQLLKDQVAVYDSAIQAGTDAATIKAQIDQLVLDIQAISESGLPSQSAMQHRALISNGTASGWQHIAGYNQFVTGDLVLEPGHRAWFTLATDAVATLPNTITQGAPFLLGNSPGSTAVLSLKIPQAANYQIPHPRHPAMAGDDIYFRPGEGIFLQAVSNIELRRI